MSAITALRKDSRKETEKATVRFHPQAKAGATYSVEKPFTFEVPVSDVEALWDNDDLKTHHNAPEKVREWEGPYHIEVQK